MSFFSLLQKAVMLVFIVLVFGSCANNYDDDSYNNTPVQNSNQNPNQQYYRNQPPPVQYQQQQPQYQRQYQPQQVPYYYSPQPAAYYPPPVYQPQGGSRFYSNPYSINPPSQYPYYDADQYYVPPTYYNNIEPQQNKILTTTGPF